MNCWYTEWKQNWLQNSKRATHMEIPQMKMNLQRNPNPHHPKITQTQNRLHPTNQEPAKQERTVMIQACLIYPTISLTNDSSCMEISPAVRGDCWPDTSQRTMGMILFLFCFSWFISTAKALRCNIPLNCQVAVYYMYRYFDNSFLMTIVLRNKHKLVHR